METGEATVVPVGTDVTTTEMVKASGERAQKARRDKDGENESMKFDQATVNVLRTSGEKAQDRRCARKKLELLTSRNSA